MTRPLVFFALSLTVAPLCPGARQPVTIDAVVNAPATTHGPVLWSPDGTRFVVTERGELRLYEVRTGKERALIELANLEKAAVPVPPPATFDWTNRRVSESSVQWFADGKRLLVAAGGDLFVVDIAKSRFEPLTDRRASCRERVSSPV